LAKTLIERTGGYEYMNARAALVQAFRDRVKATGKDQNGIRPKYPSYRKAEHKRLMNSEGRYDRDVSMEKPSASSRPWAARSASRSNSDRPAA
jgi:hypothetical protein